MDVSKPRLIALMNSYSQGKSGGDMVFIEVVKRIKEYDPVIITSLLGKELCQKNGLRGEYLLTTHERRFRHLILTYFQRIIKALFLKIKIKKNDILLATSDFLPDVLPVFWLKRKNSKVKWIQHIFHLISPSRKIPFLAQRISFFLIKQRADLIIVDNRLLQDKLAKLGFNPSKVFVNYPGIKLSYLRTVKRRERVGYDGVYMAQLRPVKGIFDLVKVWKLVCQKEPDSRLGVIGQGLEGTVRKLKGLIKSEDLEKNINLLGYLEDDEAFTIIKASKVFVFPSHEEGFGLAPLEAQACGLPVVAWHIPAYDEVFQEGMVKVKIGKVEKFANEVVKLLTNKRLHRLLAKKAISNSGRYNWHQVAQKELKLIQKVNQ